MKPGDLVRHQNAPTWGVGVVVELVGDHARINFEDQGEKLIRMSAGGSWLVPVTRDDVEADSALLDPDRWHEYNAPPSERRKATPSPRCNHCGERLKRGQHSADRRLKSCPRCSQTNGREHVFYESPSAFGTSEKRESEAAPEGPQSHCIACRTKTAPEFPARPCSTVQPSK